MLVPRYLRLPVGGRMDAQSPMAEARRQYEALEDDARSWLREGGFESDVMRFEREADLRYARQQLHPTRTSGA